VKCDQDSTPLEITGITSGDYMIRLSNGRLLWSRKLQENQICWELAFPGREYPAAAMTEPTQASALPPESLLGGSLILEIFPGLETAMLRISLVKAKNQLAKTNIYEPLVWLIWYWLLMARG